MYRFSDSEPSPWPTPPYRRHKTRDCGVVTLDGKNHFLGQWRPPESHENYAALIAEWTRTGCGHPPDTAPTRPADPAFTVNDLILAYFRFAQTLYVKFG
jgi:hypothetical protein